MLSDAPSWRDKLVDSIENQKIFEFSRTGMSVCDVVADLRELGMRGFTMEELINSHLTRSR